MHTRTSSYFLSSNPIVNVFVLIDNFFCIKVETREESIPPDKKVPTGTSEINCDFIEFVNNSSVSLIAFSSFEYKSFDLELNISLAFHHL